MAALACALLASPVQANENNSDRGAPIDAPNVSFSEQARSEIVAVTKSAAPAQGDVMTSRLPELDGPELDGPELDALFRTDARSVETDPSIARPVFIAPGAAPANA